MKIRPKLPLLLPIIAITIVSSFILTIFFSVQQVNVNLPSHPDIQPNLFRDGANFGGYIDICIPINITNNSPASLRNIRVSATISVISIESIGLFPDTTIINISQFLPDINSKGFLSHQICVYVSSWIPILAIIDAYLVLDIDISSNYHLGLLNFPIHLVTRFQEQWKAPFGN